MFAAKIIFTDPKEAANHINEVWENPNQWWLDKSVIEARRIFLEQGLGFRDGDWCKNITTAIDRAFHI